MKNNRLVTLFIKFNVYNTFLNHLCSQHFMGNCHKWLNDINGQLPIFMILENFSKKLFSKALSPPQSFIPFISFMRKHISKSIDTVDMLEKHYSKLGVELIW